MSSEVSQKIAKFAHDYRSRLLQEQGKTSLKMTKYDVALFMKNNGALSESEFNSWVHEKEGEEALQLTTQQKEALQRGTIFNFVNQQSYLDSDEINDFSISNLLGFEKTSNFKPIKQQFEEQKLNEHISKLPKTDKTYNELKYDIESSNMSKSEKLDAQLKLSAEKFHKAIDNDETGKAVGAFMQGIGLAFSKACYTFDDRFGINRLKQFIRGHVPVMLPGGVVTTIDMDKALDILSKWADDSDSSHLSLKESIVSATKAGVDVADSFIGSEMLCFMGVLGAIVKSAEGAKYAKLVSGTLMTLFTTMGVTDEVVGVTELANAKTQAEAESAFTNIWNGLIVLGGTGYSFIQAKKVQISQQKAEGVESDGSGNLYSGFGFINELFGKKSKKVTETKPAEPTDLKSTDVPKPQPEIPKFDRYKLKMDEADNPTNVAHLEPEDIGLSVSCRGHKENYQLGISTKIDYTDVRKTPGAIEDGHIIPYEKGHAVRFYDPEQNVTAVVYYRYDAGEALDGVYVPGRLSQADAEAIERILKSKYCYLDEVRGDMFKQVDWKAVQAEVAEFLNKGGTRAASTNSQKTAVTSEPKPADVPNPEQRTTSVEKKSEPQPPKPTREAEPQQKLEYGGSGYWQPKPTPKPVTTDKQFLNETELGILNKNNGYMPQHIQQAIKNAFEELGVRLRNGEKPSKDLLFTVSNFISQKSGVANGIIMGTMEKNMYQFYQSNPKWASVLYEQPTEIADFLRTRE